MENISTYISENILHVRQKIVSACEKCGRDANDITLMAVSKTQPIKKLQAAINSNLTLFGENRVQEFRDKAEFFAQNKAQCHIIGTLQKNKVKYLPPLTNFIQSADSPELCKEIEKQYAKVGKTVCVLLQVNIANEATKSGIQKQNILQLANDICKNMPHINLKGLMCIPPPLQNGKNELINNFSQMKYLFDDLKSRNIENSDISVLSMGMSDDYDIAIMHGSTLVRVGSAIFGQRYYGD